jgi:hypothetical protein
MISGSTLTRFRSLYGSESGHLIGLSCKRLTSSNLITVESSHEMNIKRPEPPPQAHQPRQRQSQIPPQNLFPPGHQHVPHMGPSGPYGAVPVAGVPTSHMPPYGQAPMTLPAGMPPPYAGQQSFHSGAPGPSGYQTRGPPQQNPYAMPPSQPNPYAPPSAYSQQQQPGNPYSGNQHNGMHSRPPPPPGLNQAPHHHQPSRQSYPRSTGLGPSTAPPRPPFKLAGGAIAPNLTGGHRGPSGLPNGSRGLPARPPTDQHPHMNYG